MVSAMESSSAWSWREAYLFEAVIFGQEDSCETWKNTI